MGIVAIDTPLFFHRIIVNRPMLIGKRTLELGMAGETFGIYVGCG
jgi:hypothetical protein